MRKTFGVLAGSLILVACCASVSAIVVKKVIGNSQKDIVYIPGTNTPLPGGHLAALTSSQIQPVDLTDAAEKTVHAVVHIKSTVQSRTRTVQEYDFFFGPRQRQYRSQPQYGYGSGVIISRDGYIVTNYHVIETADEIEATLNDGRVFTATVIGSDPQTDLALLKIDGKDFPTIPFGDSGQLRLGEWVLAVGNPFNLTSSVTAGVVSAKSRKIGVYDEDGGIESFIQTDAAINMGNSGGALVNVKGELVGINAALESPTGTYAGYGFAIPSTIVRKVVSDLKEFGSVQRAILGISGRDLSEIRQLPENRDKDFGANEGAYVVQVLAGGGASAAGIREGDVIISVNGRSLRTMNELQETLAQYRPGDKVEVTLLRSGKQKTVTAELKNLQGNTEIVSKSDMQILGASFQDVPATVRNRMQLSYGMQVSEVGSGLFKDAGIQRGFIILKINGRQISSFQDIETVYAEAQKSQDQVLFISGVTSSGSRMNYAIGLE
ncbi:MAG: Do family serine endopeptidase [Bacteroidaceae bacterium]|nr:Do family serine endopeptidase [Bacteroidaceae bacterium]